MQPFTAQVKKAVGQAGFFGVILIAENRQGQFVSSPQNLDRGHVNLDLAGGLHAVEHAVIGMLPLFAMCDRNDIGGVSTLLHPDTGAAQVFVYDAYPGGVGIAAEGLKMLQDLWERTLELVSECPCAEGCPSCIQSPRCGNNNEPLDKAAAVLILRALLGDYDS